MGLCTSCCHPQGARSVHSMASSTSQGFSLGSSVELRNSASEAHASTCHTGSGALAPVQEQPASTKAPRQCDAASQVPQVGAKGAHRGSSFDVARCLQQFPCVSSQDIVDSGRAAPAPSRAQPLTATRRAAAQCSAPNVLAIVAAAPSVDVFATNVVAVVTPPPKRQVPRAMSLPRLAVPDNGSSSRPSPGKHKWIQSTMWENPLSPDNKTEGAGALVLSPTGAPSRPQRSPDGRFRRGTSAIERYEMDQQLNQSRLRSTGTPQSANGRGRVWTPTSDSARRSDTPLASPGAGTGGATSQSLATDISEDAFTGGLGTLSQITRPPRIHVSMMYAEVRQCSLRTDTQSFDQSINESLSTIGTPMHMNLSPTASGATWYTPTHRHGGRGAHGHSGSSLSTLPADWTSSPAHRALGIRTDVTSDSGAEFSSDSTLKCSTPRTPHGTRGLPEQGEIKRAGAGSDGDTVAASPAGRGRRSPDTDDVEADATSGDGSDGVAEIVAVSVISPGPLTGAHAPC